MLNGIINMKNYTVIFNQINQGKEIFCDIENQKTAKRYNLTLSVDDFKNFISSTLDKEIERAAYRQAAINKADKHQTAKGTPTVTLPTIKATLMSRDNLTSQAAEKLITEAQEALVEYLESGDMESAQKICMEYFGLEPDYVFDLI